MSFYVNKNYGQPTTAHLTRYAMRLMGSHRFMPDMREVRW